MHIKNKTMLATTLVAVAGGLALSACGKAKSEDKPGGGPAEVSVYTVKAAALPISTELNGRTAAFRVAEVRPQVGGIIQRRQFNEGGEIRQGESLYQIDPASYQAALDSAQATLAKVEANVTVSRLKVERYQELVKIKAVSQQDYDEASATLKQGEADVAAAKAAVANARINLGYTRILAPIAGRVGRSAVTPGALVTANQANALATIQQLDPIYVDVTQTSTELMRLRRDLASGALKRSGKDAAKVSLVLEDGTVYPLPGSLQFSEVSVDPGTGSVTLRAVFPNPKQELLPGMYVRARLEEGIDEAAILVPQQGVTRDAKGNAVALVLNGEDKVEQRQLKTRRALGDQWQVTDGLKEGDRLIVEGLQKVKPGASAKPVPFQPAGSAAAPAAKP
ncbi:efflux RND transporter periplasmic adaptor subunit [Chitinimonas sp.]|uniref:efflux RND transporter periplasmic adaptor subunit n=1 Tax=Chitinimonas sp. TaxID=1934313 RepID=UPI002F947F06